MQVLKTQKILQLPSYARLDVQDAALKDKKMKPNGSLDGRFGCKLRYILSSKLLLI